MSAATIIPEDYALLEHDELGLDDANSVHCYGVLGRFHQKYPLCGATNDNHACWDGHGPLINIGDTHCPRCGKPVCQYCLFWLEYWNRLEGRY